MVKDRSPEPHYLRCLRQTQYCSPETIADLQWRKLKAIIQHAYETIPYYRERFREVGATPADIAEPDDLLGITPLTKNDVQEHRERMVSELANRSALVTDQTGGSTGVPLSFYYDADRLASRQAATIRHNEWAGWRVGDKVAILWAAPRDIPAGHGWKRYLRNRLLERTMILDASGLTEAKMASFTNALEAYRPRILLGYANTMALYARYVQENRITTIRPHAITCSAEVLRETDRKLIEEAFACPVFNRYGSREVAVIASECEKHDGMHINAENLYLEFVHEGKHVAPGETGEILITDMTNRAMPLIRYRIMDAATPFAGICSCGRGLARMEIQEGRVTDFIVTPAGMAVSGVALATYVVPAIPGLRKAQFVQESVLRITANIVAGDDNVQATIDLLLRKLREFLGTDMEITIRVVKDTPCEDSGKFRFIKSTLSPERIMAAVSRRDRPHG